MSFSQQDINKLLSISSDGVYHRWESDTIVTYSFVVDGAAPGYYTEDLLRDQSLGFGTRTQSSDARAIGGLQRIAFVKAAEAWEKVAFIQLVPQGQGDGDITVGAMPITTGSVSFPGAVAITYYAGYASGDWRFGDLWLASGKAQNSDAFFESKGSSGYWTMLHELGHGLGLNHYGWINTNLPMDSWRYSVMSYTNLSGRRFGNGTQSGAPSAPMLLDIAAIQRYYGANPTTEIGNNTYKFERKDSWPIQAIWDAGGNDTIDGSDQTDKLTIDLNPGGISFVGRLNGTKPQIHVAYTPADLSGNDVLLWSESKAHFIENAIGGSKVDTIFGNSKDNRLDGRHGDDKLFGGLGIDTYAYAAGDGADTIDDSDHLGHIEINGVVLSGTFSLVKKAEVSAEFLRDFRADDWIWRATIGGNYVYLFANQHQVATGTELRIAGPALGQNGSITIKNFVSDFAGRNDFGITLDPTNTFTAVVSSASLLERSSNKIKIDLAAPAVENQRAKISVGVARHNDLQLLLGAEVRSFDANGEMEVELEAGQDTFYYSLISTADIDQDSALNFAATLLDANRVPILGSAATVAITLDAINETDPIKPTSFVHTFVGQEQIQNWLLAENLNATTLIQDDDRATQMGYTYENPAGLTAGATIVAFGVGGSDELSFDAAQIWADGGTGDDLVRGNSSRNVLIGGAGSDSLVAGSTVNGPSDNGHRLFGDLEVSLEQALIDGELQPSSAAVGDYLSSSADSNDLLVGSSARDVLAGGGGADTFSGGAGDDLILGDRSLRFTFNGQSSWPTYTWDWSFQSSTGPGGAVSYSYSLFNHFWNSSGLVDNNIVETASLAAGADSIYAGAGNDAAYSGGGDDFADMGTGNDVAFGGSGADTLLGSAGDDVLVGDGDSLDPIAGNDFLDGGDGDDTVHGSGGADVLYGGNGNDIISGDALEADAGEDYANGENGDDQIWGGAKSDVLIGGAGNDKLYGDNVDTTTAAAGDDFLDGGEGDDELVGFGGADTLIGGAGNDVLRGGYSVAVEDSKSDYLDGGAGNDTLFGWGGDDSLFGGEGDDQLIGDELTAPAAQHGNDELDGGAGKDLLFGMGGDDILSGGADDDSLYGGAGNDTLIGGLGQDVLRGEAGDDTYRFDAADLLIVNGIADGIIDTEGRNQVVFNSGLTSQDVHVAIGTDGATINLTSSDGTLGLVIRSALMGGVDTIQFADGVTMTAAQLVGSKLDSPVSLDSDEDGAQLFGGTQHDELFGMGNNAIIVGGRGNDFLFGNNVASTTYRIERGDGQDTIVDLSTEAASNGVDKNVVAFGEDIYLEDLTVQVSVGGSGATVDLGFGDQLLLLDFSFSDPLNGPRALDAFKFADGSTVTWQQLLTQRGLVINNANYYSSISGTVLDDQITGVDIAETIDAGAGNDILNGGAGNDVLAGGTGSDAYLFGRGAGGDTINNNDTAADKLDALMIADDIAVSEVDFYRVGDALIVQLRDTADQVFVTNYFTTAGLDAISFADGTVFTAADVPWQAGPPPHVINFQRGDGNRGYSISDVSDSIVDRLRFGANVDPATVRLSSNSSGDLVVRFANPNGTLNSTDILTFTGAVTNAAAALNQIAFAGTPGLIWTGADLLALARVATTGNDFIYGGTSDDTLSALAGNDTVRGGAGDDTLRGGTGIDDLYGDAGSDTFRIERADAAERILGTDSNLASIDRIEFGVGILPEDVRAGRLGDELTLTHYDPVSGIRLNTVTIPNYFATALQGQTVDEIRFVSAPGTVWLMADVIGALSLGGPFNDSVGGVAGNDVVRGFGGDDTLLGADGNDDLDGGVGDDVLYGGAGDDLYRFARNSGADRIVETSGTDRVVLASGILPSDVQLYRTSGSPNGDLALVLNGSSDQLVVYNAFGSGDPRIESIEFANGVVWDATTIASMTTNVSGALNTQTGTAGNDVFAVDHPLDFILESADAGTDLVNSSASYMLPVNVENLNLTGVLNINGTGNALDNVITGTANRNVLDGGAGVDTLIGGAGDDTYIVDDSGFEDFNDGWSDGSQDVVQEDAGGGYDTVRVNSFSATLAANVERLQALTFTGNFSYYGQNQDMRRRFVGNDLDNVIDTSGLFTGSNYAYFGTYLNGGLGADTYLGGDLADTYVVESSGDRVFERGVNSNGAQLSYDTVESSISFTLGDNLEALRLTGSAAIDGTGNDLNNLLDGANNSAANVLTGGLGDDTYRVGLGDVIVESSTGGINDIVLVAAPGDYFLSNFLNVEEIRLDAAAGTASVTGNADANRIIGNAGVNTLDGAGGDDDLSDNAGDGKQFDSDILLGGDGNDRLSSSAGMDVLDGGAGDDLLLQSGDFGKGSNVTVIFGRDRGHDVFTSSGYYTNANVSMAAGVLASDVRVTRDGADLLVSIAGDTGSLRVTAYFVDATSYQRTVGIVGQIGFADGSVWAGATIVNRVRASLGAAASEGDDALGGTVGNDNISALGGNDFVFAAPGNDTVAGGAGNDELQGETGDDLIIGGQGEDILIGGSGADSYQFGLGSGSDTIIESGGAVEDASIDELVFEAGINPADIQLSFGPNIPSEPDLLVRNLVSGDQITVRSQFNAEFGYPGGDHIERIRFANGVVWDAAEILSRATQIIGTEGDDFLVALATRGTPLFGLGGNDTLQGQNFNDTLDGGAGNDSMSGAGGDDIYVVDAIGDTVTEFAGQGTDLVRSSVNWTLGADVENLTLTGTGAINGTGNLLANLITGNSSNNTLTGAAGADTLIGGAGDDTYSVENTGDVVIENAAEGTDLVLSTVNFTLPTNVENLTLNGSAANATGNAANNALTGNSSANTLDGGTGADTLAGGGGNDIYLVDDSGDVVTEASSAGTDIVRASVSYTLGANVENLLLTGSASINGTGNSAVNTLTGNSGDNLLNGGTGVDTMIGGAGNDTYVVDVAGETITENLNEGTDTVQTTVAITLAAHVENLLLLGTLASGTGNSLANVITGNSANNTLDGGTGVDTLIGLAGNDTYTVDNPGDVITENANEGTDLVNSSANYTLSANVENLTFTGSGGLNGTGNALANTLTGNSGANVLDGGAGVDTLIGGMGNDTYIVDDPLDVITEAASAGTDLVQSSATYTLATNVENLTLTGNAAINGTGNSVVNVITGNSGDNLLNGSTGVDTMIGGAGNDTYVVEVAGETVTENLNEGIDTVQSAVTYTLGNHLENLTLTGTSVINGTGNTANNVLTGNAFANTLDGGSGDDTLAGGGGADSLTGGLGADTYQYTSGGGADTINNVAADSLIDRLQFMDLASTQVTFSRPASTNNLVMTRVGVITDKVTVTNWFSATANRLDFVDFTNRQVTAAEIDSLIAGGGGSFAMGGAAPPAAMLRVREGMTDEPTLNASGSTAAARRALAWSSPVENFEDAELGDSDIFGISQDFTLAKSSGRGQGGYARWEPIKSFVGSVALDAGVDRLVSAMASFGAEGTLEAAMAPPHDLLECGIVVPNALSDIHMVRGQVLDARTH